MAAERKVSEVKLQVRLDNGFTSSGAQAVKSVSLTKIKTDATDDQLLAAGEALGSIADTSLIGVRKVETSDLTQGE